jgi:glycosyltransferase involved in cell wall biosynthesis
MRRSVFLMPVFNPSASKLARTMDSMTDQTEPADIVIVDDGSTPSISQQLPARDGLVILRLDRNQGITAALNHGLAYIRGRRYDYVARMDCGDICSPDRIERQQAYLDRHPQVDLIGAFARIVDEDGHHLFFEGTTGGEAAIRRKLYDNAAFKHPTFFFRTHCVQKFGPYSAAYPYAEDYEFMRRVCARGRVDCLDDILLSYEKSESGLSNRNRHRQLLSRLKIQLRYMEPASIRAYWGIARTLITLLFPARLWAKISKLYWQGRDGERHRPRVAG